MSAGTSINKAFAVVFGFIGLFMAWMGIALLSSGPKNNIEWTICVGALGSGALLIYSAWSTWRKGTVQERAEHAETIRLNTLKQGEKRSAGKSEEGSPTILATWYYPKDQWNKVLTLLAKKTKKEEWYTVIWFPILFAVVFFSLWWVGLILGILFGWFYMWFRVNYVKKNFKIAQGKDRSEVVITDAYLNVNGNFVHYGDGRYYLKSLTKKSDEAIGNHLHFVVGWFTSKGLPAQLDLYLPIPQGKEDEAESVIEAYQSYR